MQNTVIVERKLRQNLTYAIVLLVVFFALSIAMLVCFSLIGKQNLNGNVIDVTGTVDKVERDGSIFIVTLNDGSGAKEYNVVWGNEKYDVDMTAYTGKTVTLVTTERTFGFSNTWVVGLKAENETVVDYNAVLQEKRAENKEMVTVAWAVFAIIGVATCAVFIWRSNIVPTAERPLAEQYAEYLPPRQPTCPARKKLLIALGVWALLLIVFIILLVCFSPEGDDEPLGAVAIVFLVLTLVTMVCGEVTLPVIARTVIFRKEIDFYAENLPFDFTDISFAPMKKSVKEQLQKEIRESREKYPHFHGDGGNGYDVEFTAEGVNLYVDYDYDGEQTASDVSDVFPDMPKGTEPFDVLETPRNVPSLTLTYGELNFEAIAHYRRNDHPMMIIIKSRLTKTDLPEEFVNDLHIALDVNVLKTVQTFNVPVENLQYLLDNKKALMLENCRKKKRAKTKE